MEFLTIVEFDAQALLATTQEVCVWAGIADFDTAG